jgi:hypothetical protein
VGGAPSSRPPSGRQEAKGKREKRREGVWGTQSFGPPAWEINAPNTFGRITSTVSTARTVELVFKFYF